MSTTPAASTEHYLKSELDHLLRTDDQIFAFIEQASLDGLWYWDLEHPEEEWMSAKFWETLGYDPAQMPHKASAWQDIINPDDLATAYTNAQRHIADPSYPYNQVVRYRHADGHEVTIRCRGMAIRDAEGNAIRMLGAHNDLTNERRIERLLTETNHAARVGSWDYNIAAETLYWSPVTKEIHEVASDYEPTVDIGVSFYKEGYSRERITEVLQNALDGGDGWDEELQLITAKGNLRWVRAVGRAVRVNDETVRLYGSFQDIHEEKLTRIQLERSERLLRVTNEAARIGWWEFDALTGKVFYSDVVNKIHGLSGPQEWTSERALSYYVDGPEKDNLLASFAKCVEDGTPYQCDFKIRDAEGHEKWIQSVGSAEKVDGKVVRVLGSFRDIHTEKLKERELDKQRRLLQQNFDLAPHAMVIASADGKFEEVSPSFTEMLGYTLSDLKGKRFSDITFEDDRERDIKAVQRMAAGEIDSYRTEKRYVAKSGKVVWADLAVVLLRDDDGTPIRYHAQLVETTEKREAELRRQRIAFLEAKSKEMEQFAYIASHDLRQPVLTIQGYIQALVEDFGPQLNEEATGYLDVVQGALTRMDDMIKGLLDYSRLNKTKQLQYVDVDALVAEVKTDLSNLLEQTNGEIIVHELTPIMGYPLELRQLFQNLIANALQYHREGVPPKVEIGCSDIDGGHEFWVADNGIGISPRDQDRVFALFQRVSTPTNNSGSGIGLASCRTIVERHGGTIWVESTLGEGSTFHFTVLDEIPS